MFKILLALIGLRSTENFYNFFNSFFFHVIKVKYFEIQSKHVVESSVWESFALNWYISVVLTN